MNLRNVLMRTALTGLAVSVVLLEGCRSGDEVNSRGETPVNVSGSNALTVEYEKFTLKNGMDVVLHVDRSDPLVAIDIAAHVGSARETEGRTGFAHLFEHLLFMDSENLGYGGLDAMNTRIGGSGTNGFTTHDMTQYFQATPKDTLEKIIWAEADKLCCFISTVSQNLIDNEKQVVKNEKRQRVDNQPYGHEFYIYNKALYPADHPYNWQVIGSLADLDAATLKDAQDFYKRWYAPNNVTVTLTGDFDMDEAKRLMKKYFEEIPAGDPIENYDPRPSNLTETKNLYYEDNFATVPQFSAVWPTVEQYHPDSYALNILMDYLTRGKKAPISEVLVDEEKLTSSVSAFHYTKELAGEAYIFITPNDGQDIDGLIPGFKKAMARFEEKGIPQADLDRIKAGLEVDFYGEMQSALGKAIALGEYNLFTGDPGFITEDIRRMQAVTTADVMRVYNQYIKDKPHLHLSIVPKGQTDLTLEGSTLAEIVEEVIVAGEGAPVDFDPAARIIENPSGFERPEPGFGDPYTLPGAEVWRGKLDNGIEIFGMSTDETPLVYFSLKIDAGNMRGDYAKPAVPDMVAAMLEKGTAHKTTAELEDAIESLGSSISVSTDQNATYMSGSTLARNFDATIALAQEMLLEPRWDEEEFDLLKISLGNDIDQIESDPNSISTRESAKLRYPEGHLFHYAFYGPKDKLEIVTLDDLKDFYNRQYTQHGTQIRIVGDVELSDVKKAFGTLASGLDKTAPPALIMGSQNPVDDAEIYFYDVAGAKQSVVRLERPALSATDPDYPLAAAINFPLGGIYTSKLNTELRVNKGYTYGIRSGFNANKDRGNFAIRTSVRSNVTKESIEIIRDIVSSYGPEFTEDDLAEMKEALLRGQALDNETLNDKLSMLGEISNYGYPDDYKSREAAAIQAMTLEKMKALTAEHMRPDAMRYVIVGDAETQAEGLKDLGYGDPIMLGTE
ncbi:MAG: insulinase family protein [Hellea sp.]|nr:insulinase family protein [Hellea sp.]